MVESLGPMDLYEELRSIVGALTTAGVPYALVGGIAVSIYATPRATEDIDLLISGDDAERAVQALAQCGFRSPGRPVEVAQGRPVEVAQGRGSSPARSARAHRS
jgi:hypothetical protein